MSIGELIFIGVIILLVVPPEKLPGLAREIARFFNDIRRTTSGVWEEIKKDTPNPMEELRKQKQDVEDYMRLIGSPEDHNKNNPDFQPVYVKPEPTQSVDKNPASSESKESKAGETPKNTIAVEKPKNESDQH